MFSQVHFTDICIVLVFPLVLLAGKYSKPIISFVAVLRHVLIRGGTGTRRLPGSGRVLHYPALPGPGRPGITLKYGRIRILGICLNFCDSQLYLTQWNAKWAFILSCNHLYMTLWRHTWPIIATWYFTGQGRWQSIMGRFNQSSDVAYNDVCIDRWSDTLLLWQRLPMLLSLKQNLDICWLSSIHLFM